MSKPENRMVKINRAEPERRIGRRMNTMQQATRSDSRAGQLRGVNNSNTSVGRTDRQISAQNRRILEDEFSKANKKQRR